jgi:hypothetical protein
MSKNPLHDALADAIRDQSAGMWSSTSVIKTETTFKIVVDLSSDLPIGLVCGSVTISSTVEGAEGIIEEYRKAVRMVRAAQEPQPPNLERVK